MHSAVPAAPDPADIVVVGPRLERDDGKLHADPERGDSRSDEVVRVDEGETAADVALDDRRRIQEIEVGPPDRGPRRKPANSTAPERTVQLTSAVPRTTPITPSPRTMMISSPNLSGRWRGSTRGPCSSRHGRMGAACSIPIATAQKAYFQGTGAAIESSQITTAPPKARTNQLATRRAAGTSRYTRT
jgi:hypothetical protein